MAKFNRLIISVITFSVLFFPALVGLAHGNNRGEAKATIGKANVSIEYGRPSLRGRDIMKMIQPGSHWRLGADAPTTLTSDLDLDFGGTRLSKGKYILLARLVEPGRWVLVVSTKSVYQYEASAKLAEVPIEFHEVKDSVEQLTIQLSNKSGRGVIEIAWGTCRLLASFAPAI